MNSSSSATELKSTFHVDDGSKATYSNGLGHEGAYPAVTGFLSPRDRGLTEAVQRNCDISDARHGGDYSLCAYLMKMREYYRWECGLPFGAPLDHASVANWLQAREERWEALDNADFSPIEIDGERFDPFDTDAINARLSSDRLVYSAGLGHRAKPHFVLAHLECRAVEDGYQVYVADEEYARDLVAPPAMMLDGNIFVRRDSLRRMLWEKFENWRWSRADNALGRAFACYDFETRLDPSLSAMADHEIDAVLLHERGEYLAGTRLGERWNDMLIDLVDTPAERMARAVRDHLADCMVTLPALADEGDAASIHFYIGNLTAMRKAIFPRLQDAYDTWRITADTRHLAELAEEGQAHWLDLAERMMDHHAQLGHDAAESIRQCVESSYL